MTGLGFRALYKNTADGTTAVGNNGIKYKWVVSLKGTMLYVHVCQFLRFV